MEQELSSDLAACVSSPEAQAGWDVTHGLEWIDRQIDAKARRREACESRQAHLADLRRLVAQRDENMATLQAPQISARSTSRLSILEDEHEELKKQVEAERLELLKVRANLQVECEERVQEAGCWLLKELAEHMATAKDRATFSAAIQAALKALEKHPGNAAVQKAARGALQSLSAFDKEGWVKMACLGRCGRLGRTATMRTLEAIQE